jgi:hypothetical protein
MNSLTFVETYSKVVPRIDFECRFDFYPLYVGALLGTLKGRKDAKLRNKESI